MSRPASILAAALLAGCAVGPDYTRTAPPLPADYGADAVQGAQVGAAWWKAFGDPVLDELVERALRENRDLAAASARVDQAVAVLGGIEAGGLPAIDASAGFSRPKASTDLSVNPPAGSPRIRPVASAGLSLAYEIDVWGRARRARESSRALLDAGREALRAAELSVAALVARTYVELRATDADLAAAEDAASAREEALRVARERERVGSARLGEFAEAETLRAAAVTRASGLRRQRAALEHLLGSLVGDAALTVPVSARPIALPAAPAAGLPAALLERRPDVRQAEALAVSANAEIGVAKGSAFPALTLTGALGSESRELSGLFTSRAATYGLGVSVEQNLLDWGRAGRRTEAAEAAARVAAANYAQSVIEALRETRDALVTLREAAVVADAAERRAVAAEQLIGQARRRFDAGEIGSVELAAARVAHAESVSAVSAARRDRAHAHIQLVKALGGGF